MPFRNPFSASVSQTSPKNADSHATPGSTEYVQLAVTLTFLVGVVEMSMGAARLGNLLNFISHALSHAGGSGGECAPGLAGVAGTVAPQRVNQGEG